MLKDGKNIKDTYFDFKRNSDLKTQGSKSFLNSLKEVNRGTIEKTSHYVENGNSFVLFKIKNNNKLFSISVREFPSSLFLKKKNIINFSFKENKSQKVNPVYKLKWI